MDIGIVCRHVTKSVVTKPQCWTCVTNVVCAFSINCASTSANIVIIVMHLSEIVVN